MTAAIVPFADLPTADLRRGSIYVAGTAGHVGDDPIHHVVPGLGNQGGIRISGSVQQPKLVALFSTLGHDDWPDEVDHQTNQVRYHGDNRVRLAPLLEPRGNQMLRHLFSSGFGSSKERSNCPPFLVFNSAHDPTLPRRSQRFEGVAVPGAAAVPSEDWLVAKWFDRQGNRFENYLLTLTVLDIAVVPKTWLQAVLKGDTLGPECPAGFRRWVETGAY